ncbi:MAG: hypothetical protein D6794_12040 [Deltaproteobacteria bacterium]|nr:MAG: hypothetical protein D6794_12040 [Deltaproteobacteria bacterium]
MAEVKNGTRKRQDGGRVLGRRVARLLDEREQALVAGAGAPIGCPTGITYVNPLDVEPEGDG